MKVQKPLMISRRKIPRSIKLAIFDLDGTLVDAFPAIADSINHMMKKMGYAPVSLRTVKRSVGWGVSSLVNNFVPEDKVAEALAIFRKHHDARLRKNIRLLPGVKALLPFLKERGCVLAIASNRPAQFCHIILKALEIAPYFDHVICGDGVKRAKPYPDMVKAILRASRIPARDAIYTGDMSVDIACGRAAGVFTLGVPGGSCTRAEIRAAKPDMFIERISQVRRLFR
jgi:HAD superfamily hydrolase (TIGR01509 family)